MALEEIRSESRAEHEYEVVFVEARTRTTDQARRHEVRKQIAQMVQDGTLSLTAICNEDPFFATLARECLMNWAGGRAIAEANPYAELKVRLKNAGGDLRCKLLRKRVTHTIGAGMVGAERDGRGVQNREAVMAIWKAGATESMGVENALHFLWKYGKEVRTWLPEDRRITRTIVELGAENLSELEGGLGSQGKSKTQKLAATG